MCGSVRGRKGGIKCLTSFNFAGQARKASARADARQEGKMGRDAERLCNRYPLGRANEIFSFYLQCERERERGRRLDSRGSLILLSLFFRTTPVSTRVIYIIISRNWDYYLVDIYEGALSRFPSYSFFLSVRLLVKFIRCTLFKCDFQSLAAAAAQMGLSLIVRASSLSPFSSCVFFLSLLPVARARARMQITRAAAGIR